MITRSADHRYTDTDTGITHPGVSDIISVVGASFDAASGYGAKHAAMAAIRLLDELPKMVETLGEEGARKAISSKTSWGPDPSGSILGTAVHDLVSRYLMGEVPGAIPLTPPQAIRLLHFTRWWEASGWTLRLSEAMVLNKGSVDGRGWGGTFDILAYDPDGKTVLADLKTGRVWPKAILQLTAYGMANVVQPYTDNVITDPPKVWPMPRPDRYVILHLTEEGLRPIEVNIGMAERMAFTAALDIWHWEQSMKGVRL